MQRRLLIAMVLMTVSLVLASAFAAPAGSSAKGTELDRLLNAENAAQKVKIVAPPVDDLAFLRRVTIDLIGRIPTEPEIAGYLALPANERRSRVVDRLLTDVRFADRWTVFFADMLRVRSNAEGGTALIAFLHQAVEKGMPYDALCRQLIAANGRANYVPEVGFVLGDNADPMALAGATSQTFLGIRIACAQCHNHPFDVWTREEFYGLAAYFGKTQRVERRFKNTLLGVFTTDVERTTVQWPPEGVGEAAQRKPMKPAFPFDLDEADRPSKPIARLVSLRQSQEAKNKVAAKKTSEVSLDDLLADADKNAKKRTEGAGLDDAVLGEAKADVRSIQLNADQSRRSQLRHELSELVTSPRNRYFARSFVNRVWAELLGRGFVMPVDDFSDTNKPSHPQTLDYLADEFVASGYDLRTLIRMIATSDAYQRSRLKGIDEPTRREAEAAFASAPVRRMMGEVLYDSIVLAGHLFDVKHEAGKNLKTEWVQEQIPRSSAKPGAKGTELASALGKSGGAMAGMAAKPQAGGGAKRSGYDLESALEVDFKAVLSAKPADEPEVEQMEMISKEQLEAEEELRKARMNRRGIDYIDRFTKSIIDDNPKFASAMRMASPAAPSHFLRIFGQPPRDALGQFRDQSASMRQSLMMLNGRLTQEASRVGELEPVYTHLTGKKPDLNKAVDLVYLEIFTRKPTAEELTDAKEIIGGATNPLEGMSDLRWALLNSHEFRFLP